MTPDHEGVTAPWASRGITVTSDESLITAGQKGVKAVYIFRQQRLCTAKRLKKLLQKRVLVNLAWSKLIFFPTKTDERNAEWEIAPSYSREWNRGWIACDVTTPAVYNPLISGHFGKRIFSCITLLTNCSRDLKAEKWEYENLSLVFCCSDQNILPALLNERWSVIEVGRWGRRWTSGVLQGRQQHLHTVEAGDWRSIISLCCYFQTGVSLSTGAHRVRDQTDSTPATSATPSTSAALHLSEQQRNNDQAESKQQAQSQFTSSDISVILHRGHTLQWLMSSILGGCLTITHRVVMPVLTNARCIAAWVMGFINLVSLREELHHI